MRESKNGFQCQTTNSCQFTYLRNQFSFRPFFRLAPLCFLRMPLWDKNLLDSAILNLSLSYSLSIVFLFGSLPIHLYWTILVYLNRWCNAGFGREDLGAETWPFSNRRFPRRKDVYIASLWPYEDRPVVQRLRIKTRVRDKSVINPNGNSSC